MGMGRCQSEHHLCQDARAARAQTLAARGKPLVQGCAKDQGDRAPTLRLAGLSGWSSTSQPSSHFFSLDSSKTPASEPFPLVLPLLSPFLTTTTSENPWEMCTIVWYSHKQYKFVQNFPFQVVFGLTPPKQPSSLCLLIDGQTYLPIHPILPPPDSGIQHGW